MIPCDQPINELSDWLISLSIQEKHWLVGWLSGAVVCNPDLRNYMEHVRKEMQKEDFTRLSKDACGRIPHSRAI